MKALLTGLSLLILTGVYFSAFRQANRQATIHGQQDLQPRISPSTFLVESRRDFVVKAGSDFTAPCGRVEASIPELGWQQSVTQKELFDGFKSELNPAHTGIFQMSFTCDNHEIGSAQISVVIGPELAAKPVYSWRLSAGKPRYAEASFYCVPVTIGAMITRGGAKPVPASVPKDAHFVLRDLKAQAPTPIPELTIVKNTAQSDPICISFPIGADYSLVAYAKDGVASNALDVSWSKSGPALKLTAYPERLQAYATNISPALIQVYLAGDTGKITPPKPLDVLFTAPPSIRSDPSSPLVLSPQSSLAQYKATALTDNSAKIEFSEPTMALTSSVIIEFLPAWLFLAIAGGAGLLGVIAGRRGDVFGQSWTAALGELLTSLVAAALLFDGILIGKIPDLGMGPMWVSVPGAAFAGIMGGYIGLGVFKALQKLTGWPEP
jgi:hypothetical protein